MLLTITSTTHPATDLGYLLHKNPARAQAFELTFGKAHVFYPEASDHLCTAALLVEVDPVGLVRGRRGQSGDGLLAQYVNDRPYAGSSLLSVAIAEVFGTAMAGRCKAKQEAADMSRSLDARLSVLPCRGGEALLRRLFEPLGWELTTTQHVLDEASPDWGLSRYFTIRLTGAKRLSELLSHLYVLVPVLDDDKHYWVGDDEVEKLVRHGAGWLATHPERELIAQRYLKHQRSLARRALERLMQDDPAVADDAQIRHAEEETALERKLSLNEQRLGSVIAALKQCGAKRVLDLGCGEGRLVRALLRDKAFDEVVGVDVSHRALEIARDKLRMERMSERQRSRVKLLLGSLTYRDRRVSGYDAAAVVEVIEHLDPPRLGAFERALFEHARPAAVVLTTPNAEYNVKFENLSPGAFRHKDHRFEWSRAELVSWATSICARFGYAVRFLPIGPEDPVVGAPTQMAVFSR